MGARGALVRRLALAGAAAALVTGCGAEFELPTEQKGGVVIPSDGSYQMIATWTGKQGIQDLLLTHGSGSQLFLLFQNAGVGPGPRGSVVQVARTTGLPIETGTFQGLFNPAALSAGGDAGINRVFVLDQGDTCLARQHPNSGACNDTSGAFNMRITHLEYYWRVHEFDLNGQRPPGATNGFSDTTLAYVWGIAADDRGNVYVAGKAIIYLPNPFEPRLTERVFQDRIYCYRRGPRPGGGADPKLPNSSWHRTDDYIVLQGTGLGTVVEPRGMDWSRTLGPALFVADFGKNWVQKMQDHTADLGGSAYYRDSDLLDAPALSNPVDVSTDADGFFYVVDQGNARVIRYSDTDRSYVQIVNVENNEQGLPLRTPVAVAADEDLVYIADREAGEVIRYRKRP
jgi:hypothetical protein